MASNTDINHHRNLSGETSPVSRILLCGVGPVPAGEPERLYAPGLRLWGISRALLAAGCAVDLLEVKFGAAAAAGDEANIHRLKLSAEKGSSLGISAESTALESALPALLIEEQLKKGEYDALVSTTDVMNAACAEGCGGTPLWCDYNGHAMAERQSMAHLYGSDEGVAAQWDYVLAPLLRADHFSGCGQAQRLALIGELGACGRLNSLTDGVELVASLPPSMVLTEFGGEGEDLRGHLVPEDAFVVLWTGGYNTWADPEALADGVLGAMERDERVRYVSTGGAIEGHDERTFARFRKIVDASRFADRFHFAGWVPAGEVASYYRLADVAVNCDRLTLEAELGWRNRIQEWIAAGVPVISTNLCELTKDLVGKNLIDSFEVGDATGLSDCILVAAKRSKEDSVRRAREARIYLLEAYAPEKIYAPLASWALRPERSPDLLGDATAHLPGVPFAFPNNSLSKRRAEEWRAIWKSDKAKESEPPPSGGILRRIARKLR